MKTILLPALASLLATAASAQPLLHAHRHAPHHAAAQAATRGTAQEAAGGSYGRGAGSFNAGAAQVPPPGFYDGYQGPGATVLRRGVAAQVEPGATEEIAPGAKQTATGGPAGGVPGFGGGM